MNKVKNEIIKNVFTELDDKNVQSITFVGSFINKVNFNDIDIVVIVKKLSKLSFETYQNKLLNIKFKNKLLKNRDIFINTSFGPLKYNNNNKIVFHLMIYETQGHIDHVIKSPFTCYDWERSNIYFKKKLNEIYPVRLLTLHDILYTRRGLESYLDDILNKKLTYSAYFFRNNKVFSRKKKVNLTSEEARLYMTHIFKYSFINFYKYKIEKNILPKKNILIKTILQFDFKSKYNQYSINEILNGNIKIAVLKYFISNLYYYCNNLITISPRVYLNRHFKTHYDSKVFIGQTINPSVSKLLNINKINYNKSHIFFISQSKRTYETMLFLMKRFKNISYNIDKRLNELDYGTAEGMDYRNFLIKYPNFKIKWANGYICRFPNGESYIDLANRVDSFIQKLIKNKLWNSVIISHNNVCRYLISKSLKISLNQIQNISIKYGEQFIFFYNDKNKLELNMSREDWSKLIT